MYINTRDRIERCPVLEARGKTSFIERREGGGERAPPRPKNADDGDAA